MGENAYFRLLHEGKKLLLKVFPENEGGNPILPEEVLAYLDKRKIGDFEAVSLVNYIKTGDFTKSFILLEKAVAPQAEEVIVTVSEGELSAIARFYPSSEGGNLLTLEDVYDELRRAGVVHGVDEAAIKSFLMNRKYCTDYKVAEATWPVEGHDAEITYHFDTEITSKPKLNEDGSVDFHQLGNIKSIEKGDVLATLKPEKLGSPGKSVVGKALPAKTVMRKRLRYGRDISLSEDQCSAISDISGHVTLVEDVIMVSNVYQVPENVGPSTGDIDHKGTVEVPGNVLTGFKIKAGSDIIVGGVVEGALLEAGGNIILKRGMQGGTRGKLVANGNVVAKFIENSTVIAGGTVTGDAILHCKVEAKGNINVTGKKGLVAGGDLETYGNITVTTAGTTMGAETRMTVLPDTVLSQKAKDLEERIKELVANIKKFEGVLVSVRKIASQGVSLTPQQEKQFKIAAETRGKLVNEFDELSGELALTNQRLKESEKSAIKVRRVVYPGVKVTIKTSKLIIREECFGVKFARKGGDVKMIAL